MNINERQKWFNDNKEFFIDGYLTQRYLNGDIPDYSLNKKETKMNYAPYSEEQLKEREKSMTIVPELEYICKSCNDTGVITREGKEYACKNCKIYED
jgi:hypothetical protein